MNLFVVLLKTYKIVYEIRRTFTLNPQVVCLLLFVANMVLDNRNQERTHDARARTHTYTGVPGGTCQTSGGCSLC